MRFSTPCLASSIVLAVSAAVYGQEKPATAVQTTPTKPAAQSAKSSAGVINDWLRTESSEFKKWDVGIQLRGRYEFKENGGNDGKYATEDFMKNPPAGKFNDNTFLYLREKVHVGYTPCSWLNVYVEGRDSSSTGDRRNPNPGSDELDMHQAYLALGNTAEFPLTTKIGRQELQYGDERMVGIGDWGNLGRSFDAGKLRFENSDVWVDAFVGRVVMPDDHNFNMPNDYDVLSGIYASSKTLVPIQESQLYVFSHNVSGKSSVVDPGWIGSPAKPQDVVTIGARVKSLPGKIGGWDYTAEIAGQAGSINGTANGKAVRLDQEGLNAAASGGYTWKASKLSPRLGAGYDFASGDSNKNDSRNQTFEPLFPTNHKVYGYMDFAGPRNIHNAHLNTSIKPAKPLSVSLDYHLFWLADSNDYFYPEGGSGRGANNFDGRGKNYGSFVGSELDLDATYNIKPWAVMRAGYGHFFVGDYVISALSKNATDADWLYIQTTLSF